MSEKTSISWCDATFNPWWGCQKVSPACDHCYAERNAKRFAPGRVLWGVGSERRTFDVVTKAGEKHWNAPLSWAKTMPAKIGRRPRVVPMPAEAARIARRRVPFEIGVSLLTKRFDAARKAAGLPALRLHDLRHAFGTWLAESGTDGPTIRDVMGHSSLTVTSRYLQSATESARRAVERLPRLGSGPGVNARADYDVRMPNPSARRGTCHDCNANGGAPAGMAWAVVCLRPQDSGKAVSRMPELGCASWRSRSALDDLGASLDVVDQNGVGGVVALRAEHDGVRRSGNDLHPLGE